MDNVISPGTSWNKTVRTRSEQECSSLKDDAYALSNLRLFYSFKVIPSKVIDFVDQVYYSHTVFFCFLSCGCNSSGVEIMGLRCPAKIT